MDAKFVLHSQPFCRFRAGRQRGELISRAHPRPLTPNHPRARRILASALACLATTISVSAATLGHPGKTYRRRTVNRPPPAELAIRIPVVVRDPQGRAVAGLRRPDFRLLVDGRLERISDFAENIVLPPPRAAHALTTPRYIALYFDDVHMDSTEIIRATDGADGYFAKHLGRWNLVGIFTASGQNTLAFTRADAKIHPTLLALHAPSPVGRTKNSCPPMTDFEAYLVRDLRQPMAREVAIEQTLSCMRLPGGAADPARRPSLAVLRQAASRADAQASRVLAIEERHTAEFLDGLDRLMDKVAALPDPRRIVVISPGFLTAASAERVDAIVQRAVRLNITLSTIDVSPQLSQPSFSTVGLSRAQAHPVELAAARYQMQVDRAAMAANVLMELAAGTAGTFVPNTYDPEYAFPMAVPLPRSHYILTFYIPPYLAHGSFHRLQVELLRHPGLSVQAEDSYFTPGQPRRVRSALRRRHAPTPRRVLRPPPRPAA